MEEKKAVISPWIIGLILVISCFISVIVFTLSSVCIRFDLTQDSTGNIGSTIGGITAPVIGIGSSILIYMSFQQQIKANKLVSEQYLLSNNFNRLIYLYAEFKEEVTKIQFQRENSTGFQALEGYIVFIQENENLYDEGGLHVALKNIINTFHSLVFKLENTELDKFDRMIIQNRINNVQNTIFWNKLTTLFINHDKQNSDLIRWFEPTKRKVDEIQNITEKWNN